MKPVTLALEKVLLSVMNSAWFAIYHGDRDLAVGDKIVLLLNETAKRYVEKALEFKGPKKLSPVVYISTIPMDSDALFRKLAETDPHKFAYVEYDGVASCLDNIKQARETLERCEYNNPFKIMARIKKIISFINQESNEDFIRGLFQAAKADGQSEQVRMQLFHEFSSQEERLQQYWAHQCCLEGMYSRLLGTKPKKVLWIENKPNQVIDLYKVLRFFRFRICLKNQPRDIDGYYDTLQTGPLDIDYDYAFLDMYLDKENKRNGCDYLGLFIEKYPHIPVFVISSSEDLDLIGDSLRSGAEAYVMKQYSVSLPFHIRKYHERMGRIVRDIKNSELRRHLRGNIRYWRFLRDSLWHGDKCYHMINHGYQHAENNWKLLNQFFPVLNTKINATDEEIYALCAATWLHDIGHAGNALYGEPDKVRDNHAITSAEYILRRPESYHLFGYSGSTSSPYATTIADGKMTCLEILREFFAGLDAAEGRLSPPERILCLTALICIFHSSKFPIDGEEAERLIDDMKLSLEARERRQVDGPVLHLDFVLGEEKRKDQLLQIVTAFRLVDAVDHNKNRVGDSSTKNIRIEACQRDMAFQLSRLCHEARILEKAIAVNRDRDFLNRIIQKAVPEEGGIRDASLCAMDVFYGNIKRAVSGELDFSDASCCAGDLAWAISESKVDTSNYLSILDYVIFLYGQESHYQLHEAIDEIRIDATDSFGRINLDFKIVTNKSKDELSEIRVKDKKNLKGKSFDKYLLGARDRDRHLLYTDDGKARDSGYLGKELDSSDKYFNDIVDIRQHKAGIYDQKGHMLYPEEALRSEGVLHKGTGDPRK